jgi:hypothetical protein
MEAFMTAAGLLLVGVLGTRIFIKAASQHITSIGPFAVRFSRMLKTLSLFMPPNTIVFGSPACKAPYNVVLTASVHEVIHALRGAGVVQAFAIVVILLGVAAGYYLGGELGAVAAAAASLGAVIALKWREEIVADTMTGAVVDDAVSAYKWMAEQEDRSTVSRILPLLAGVPSMSVRVDAVERGAQEIQSSSKPLLDIAWEFGSKIADAITYYCTVKEQRNRVEPPILQKA